ncbi:hypothetical protein RDABS01_021498 [Bienertia sinuspersici]
MLETLSTRLDTLEKTTPNTTKTLEKLVQKATDQYAYHESPDSDITLPAKVPDKFSATDLPKFKPTDDPRFHLKGFRAIMTIKGVDPVLHPKVFPLSLDPMCQKWFFSLSDKDTATWEGITTRNWKYYHVQPCSMGRGSRPNGETPSEKEMVLETFDKVYHIGIEIEDDLLKANDSNNGGSNINNKGKWRNSNYSSNKKTNTPSSSKGVNNVDINAVETTRAPPRRPRREYTPLGIIYTQAFDRLKSKGFLSPIGPTADPPAERRSPRWDPNKYCKYHHGKGHTTEECWTLKNKLQDMVESGQLPVPPGGKKPNTDTSPLTVLMISAEEAPFDPVDYITSVGQELPPWDEDEESTLDSRLSRVLFSIGEGLESLDTRIKALENESKEIKKLLLRTAKSTHRAKKLKKPPTSDRQYTPLAVSQTQAYRKLLAEGLTALMGPTLDPKRKSASWDPAKYCDYHRGRGHSTEECRKVRDLFRT